MRFSACLEPDTNIDMGFVKSAIYGNIVAILPLLTRCDIVYRHKSISFALILEGPGCTEVFYK